MSPRKAAEPPRPPIPDAPVPGLPTEPQGEMQTCHACRLWKPRETITVTETGVPVCAACSPPPDVSRETSPTRAPRRARKDRR